MADCPAKSILPRARHSDASLHPFPTSGRVLRVMGKALLLSLVPMARGGRKSMGVSARLAMDVHEKAARDARQPSSFLSARPSCPI